MPPVQRPNLLAALAAVVALAKAALKGQPAKHKGRKREGDKQKLRPGLKHGFLVCFLYVFFLVLGCIVVVLDGYLKSALVDLL